MTEQSRKVVPLPGLQQRILEEAGRLMEDDAYEEAKTNF